jgi:hypothetical protein
MAQVSDSVAYGKVRITDGLTTDAMTTTLVHGKAEGYKYTVKGAIGELYSVTAKSPSEGQREPTVTFTINGNDYSGTKKTAVIDGTSYEYWSYSVGEGENAVEYKMTLADVSTDGDLTWNLTGIGTLMDGYTYSASFVVWPDQDAYDYVAALNNKQNGHEDIRTITNSKGETVPVEWSTSALTYQDLRSTKGYEKGGVEQYPSIVKYSNGTFAVLTNTDQSVEYSIVETKTVNGETEETYDGPYSFDLPTPDPMPLTATNSELKKIWNVERDPGILAQFLYEYNGDSKNVSLNFEIQQGIEKTHYTNVKLGWDEDANKYNWKDGQTTHNFEDRETHELIPVTIGKSWADDFSIATGLMLSGARMDALGLDKNGYPSATKDGVTYYILEEGHDYTIKEPQLNYNFDFVAPVYHPMLVDGVLRNVNMTMVDEGNGTSYSISTMDLISVDDAGKSSLTVENTLRGYLNLNKEVVGLDEKTVENDNTKFTYEVQLNNTTGAFKNANNIPWYGINGLFYHDDELNYYQVSKNANNANYTLVDEAGKRYQATSDNFDGGLGPATLVYKLEDETQKTVTLYVM